MGALRLLAALLAELRCLRLAIPCRHPSVRSGASSDALPHRPGLWSAGVPPALPSWRQRGLPGSWATRSTFALLSDPGRASVPSRCFRHVGAAPALRTTKAPTIILSWLNDTASVVAVYASSPGSPPTNARLASGCRLPSTGWDWLPTGWLRQVSDASFTSSSPPRLGLAQSESNNQKRAACDSPGSPRLTPHTRAALHRLRHCQPATALTVVMAFHHRSVGPQTRQACYGRDHPVNDSEVTERHRQPVTALTVVMALHHRSVDPTRGALA